MRKKQRYNRKKPDYVMIALFVFFLFMLVCITYQCYSDVIHFREKVINELINQ